MQQQKLNTNDYFLFHIYTYLILNPESAFSLIMMCGYFLNIPEGSTLYTNVSQVFKDIVPRVVECVFVCVCVCNSYSFPTTYPFPCSPLQRYTNLKKFT